MPTRPLYSGFQQVRPRGRRLLDLVRVVGQADDLEEHRRPERVLRLRDQLAVVLALGDPGQRLDQVLGDRPVSAGPGSCSITSIGGLLRFAVTLAI